MAKYKKRADGRYQANITVEYDESSGKENLKRYMHLLFANWKKRKQKLKAVS